MDQQTLPCGCTVEAYRDFLQRGVGRILEKGVECPHAEHTVGVTVLLPGRQHARPGEEGGPS